MSLFDPGYISKDELQTRFILGLRECCMLLEKCCKEMRLKESYKFESLYVLNRIFNHNKDTIVELSETPKQILVASSIMARFKIQDKEKSVLTKPEEVEKLIDVTFEGKLDRKERAVNAAFKKTDDILDMLQLDHIPETAEREFYNILKEENVTAPSKKVMYAKIRFHVVTYIMKIYRSDICVTYPPSVIALSCIYLVLRLMSKTIDSCTVDDKTYNYISESVEKYKEIIEPIIFDILKIL